MADFPKVDVCIPSLRPLSREFVEHLHSRIPVHCLLTSSVVGRGKARQDLIDHVDTEWFVFVDDDIRLRPNWWSEVSKMAAERVGGVEGLWSYALMDKRVDDYARSMVKLARLLRRKAWTEKIDRAFTGDTLVRTAAVKQIRIPGIQIYEDEFIRRHIERNGFQWLRTRQIVCDHLRTYNLAEAYESGEYAFYFGKITPLGQIRRLAQLPLRILFSLYYTRNVGVGVFVLKRETQVLKGVLHAFVRRSRRQSTMWFPE